MEGLLVQGRQPGWRNGVYDADTDWLFNDADGDGRREYGPGAGYTDDDPSFGERLFISLDTNANGRLDPGEPLVGLGTSKLIATLLWPDVIRYRGVNLIETPVVDSAWVARYGYDDRADHGTGVASVLGGGWAGSGRRLTGVAPGVELILVDFNNELGLPATLSWALSLDVQVASHPYGHKIFSFLDGSSNDELAIDLAAERHGALQVVSVGNEANNRDDATVAVTEDAPAAVPFELRHYDWQDRPITLVAVTIRWRRPEVPLGFRVIDPVGGEASLGDTGGSTTVGEARLDYSYDVSPRGTAKLDMIFQQSDGLAPGTWTIEIASEDPEATEVWLTLYNDVFRGGMGTSFTGDGQVDPMATVSGWATADRAVGACSYGTRQSYGGEVIGQLSTFSSRGRRIDGYRVVDICAPGDNDIIWALAARGDRPFGGYAYGGGTSAAAPHVAGAIALLRQAAPWATASEIEDALYGAALADELVLSAGDVPNDSWGFGKLRVADALDLLPLPPGETSPPEGETDREPWEHGFTPEPASPESSPEPQILRGVEGGGCHCQAADAPTLPRSNLGGRLERHGSDRIRSPNPFGRLLAPLIAL